MKVSLKTAFSILDGRLSTNMDDVYKMLNYIFDADFTTIALPMAMDKLKRENPIWFSNAVGIVEYIKRKNKTDDFNELMALIEKGFPTYEVKLGKCV